MTLVDLVFDEGPTIGLGHRRRMEALGVALGQRGAAVRLRPTGALFPDPPAEVTVVDSYQQRADNGSFGAGRLVAVDDLNRDLAVDLLVRPCPVSGEPVAERATRVLLGFEYALLAPHDAPGDEPGPAAQRILVTLGGSDVDGFGAAVASATARRLPSAEVRHAPGPWSQRSNDPLVMTADASNGLGDELASAEIIVTAGGVTMLESLALGRPTVVVVTADNQVAQARAVDAADAAQVLDRAATVEEVVGAVQVLLSDEPLRVAMGERGRVLIDGRGADRVAEAVLELA